MKRAAASLLRLLCSAVFVLLIANPTSSKTALESDNKTLDLSAQLSDADVVYLKNGSVIRGTVVELVPGSTVKIRTSDGSVFVYEMDDVERIGKAPVGVHPSNANTVHRQIAKWGLVSMMSATLVGSLVMDDEFAGTTLIPVVGPFVTLLRIEKDPNAFYRPGGKELLIASGVAQTGFLIYFIASWATEKSNNAKFTVSPSPRLVGATMRYSF